MVGNDDARRRAAKAVWTREARARERAPPPVAPVVAPAPPDIAENMDKARSTIKDMKIVLENMESMIYGSWSDLELGTILSVAGKVEYCGKLESVELRNGGTSAKRVVPQDDWHGVPLIVLFVRLEKYASNATRGGRTCLIIKIN